MSHEGTDAFADLSLAPGTPLQVTPGVDAYPLAALGSLDPRNAMTEVLAAYLRCAVFKRGGGDTAADKTFQLRRVEPVWPDPRRDIEYPSASIVDNAAIPYEEHALTPTALEETWGVFAEDTVLWKTGEAVARLQVDYWCTDDPTREAILARLPSLFNPGEGRAGVLLSGDPRYFRRPVRATLLEHQRADTEGAVYERDRRAYTVVQCEIDVVHLRQAVAFDPRVKLSDDEPEEDCS